MLLMRWLHSAYRHPIAAAAAAAADVAAGNRGLQVENSICTARRAQMH